MSSAFPINDRLVSELSPEIREAFRDLALRGRATTAASTVTVGNVALTVEGMLAMLQMRMDDLNEQMRTRFSELSSKTARATELQSHLTTLDGLNRKAANRDISFPIDEASLSAEERAAFAEAGVEATTEFERDDYQRRYDSWATTQAEHDAWEARPEGERGLEPLRPGKEPMLNATFVANDVVDASSAIKRKLEITENGNEIGLIELQSIMQQRNQELGLVTNILRAMDEAVRGIIGNIR